MVTLILFRYFANQGRGVAAAQRIKITDRQVRHLLLRWREEWDRAVIHGLRVRLPGYSFSDRPFRAGMNTFRIAGLWAELMKKMGYSGFEAQGGDIGASVTTILGLRHADQVCGNHLNYIPGSYVPFLALGEELVPAER